jgi:hypothetical protein
MKERLLKTLKFFCEIVFNILFLYTLHKKIGENESKIKRNGFQISTKKGELLKQKNSTRVSSLEFLASLGKEVGPLLVRRLGESGLGPEVRGQEAVGASDGLETGLQEVTLGLGATTGGGVAVINTSEGQETLGNGGSDNTGTTGSRDDTAGD